MIILTVNLKTMKLAVAKKLKYSLDFIVIYNGLIMLFKIFPLIPGFSVENAVSHEYLFELSNSRSFRLDKN